jgi:hypothetical protein
MCGDGCLSVEYSPGHDRCLDLVDISGNFTDHGGP